MVQEKSIFFVNIALASALELTTKDSTEPALVFLGSGAKGDGERRKRMGKVFRSSFLTAEADPQGGGKGSGSFFASREKKERRETTRMEEERERRTFVPPSPPPPTRRRKMVLGTNEAFFFFFFFSIQIRGDVSSASLVLRRQGSLFFSPLLCMCILSLPGDAIFFG